MRIAFVSHASVLNGAPICLAELVEEILKEAEPGDIIVGVPASGPLLEKYDLPGAEIFFYAGTFGGREVLVTRPRIGRRLRKIFIEKEIDLVVANSLESFQVVQAAADSGIPVIWMIHELLTTYRDRREIGKMKDAARLADRLIFNSRTALELAPILGEGLREKSRVIYPGIPLFPRGDDADTIQRVWGLKKEGVILGSIGDICPQKGYELLIRAFEIYARDDSAAQLLIIGRTPERYREFQSRMSDLGRELGIDGQVVFMGEKIDILPWIKALDLLIHPSWRESFGRVIIEALAREVPVVATRSGGAEEILIDGDTGLLVPQRDPEALAAAIRRMISRPAQAREMARRGRAVVEEKFTIARAAAELKEEIARFQ